MSMFLSAKGISGEGVKCLMEDPVWWSYIQAIPDDSTVCVPSVASEPSNSCEELFVLSQWMKSDADCE